MLSEKEASQKTLIAELMQVRFDGADIHSFDGEVVAMSDIQKVVEGLVDELNLFVKSFTKNIEEKCVPAVFDSKDLDSGPYLGITRLDVLREIEQFEQKVLVLLGAKEA